MSSVANYLSKLSKPCTNYIDDPALGVVLAAGTGFPLEHNPDTVRAPDVAFLSRERIEAVGEPPEGYWQGAPDLAVEGVSPNDSYSDVREKAFKRLDGGAKMAIVAGPRRRDVTVYRSRMDIAALTEAEHLTGGDVVPGRSIRAQEIFA